MIRRVYEPIASMVQSMRKIRDEISEEIKDMTFAEERAFLDKLLQGNKLKTNANESNNPRLKS